jgi:putative nucleotidyltransferase with HDIG domain
MAIAYDQRFAIGMSTFFCLFACLAVGPMESKLADINLFITMIAGAITCCFCLKEIRTRIKLLQVSTLAAIIVFITAAALNFLSRGLNTANIIRDSALHAGITLVVGVLIQGLLPLIEKAFRIATSMTLLDYSDANQKLLKRLHMEAPGTFSHSLLIGSIAEAAAEAIGRNGLLCRVGAYYHDIGKINKANYFIENELGSASRHKELAPTMSHLIIVGHVKDGIEMAKEYGLPSVIRQFIETHHGTTLIEHFYNEAKKQKAKNSKGKNADAPAESEFRYPGPKPRIKEAAIVMLADTVESAVRSLPEVTPTKIEAVVHNMAMKRLQDGQFDECDMSLRELSQIEASISKTLAAHYHGRIAYPKPPDEPLETESKSEQREQKNNKQS